MKTTKYVETSKYVDVEQLERLIYTERPPCNVALGKVIVLTVSRALAGSTDDGDMITFLLSLSSQVQDREKMAKIMWIALSGRLPYV